MSHVDIDGVRYTRKQISCIVYIYTRKGLVLKETIYKACAKATIKFLHERELIRDSGHNGDAIELTEKGYSLAKKLHLPKM